MMYNRQGKSLSVVLFCGSRIVCCEDFLNSTREESL